MNIHIRGKEPKHRHGLLRTPRAGTHSKPQSVSGKRQNGLTKTLLIYYRRGAIGLCRNARNDKNQVITMNCRILGIGMQPANNIPSSQ